jgi:hypothetical protein
LKLVRQSPAQAVADHSPFDPKHKMREQCDLTARRNTAAYPSQTFNRFVAPTPGRLGRAVSGWDNGLAALPRSRARPSVAPPQQLI